MAFIVEDGTARSDSNSLVSVSYFQSYCTDRGYTLQAAWDDGRVQVDLVKATDFLEGRYGLRFSGRPVTSSQALSWPRYQALKRSASNNAHWNGFCEQYIPINEVPNGIQSAVCELALVADVADLSPIITAQDLNTVSETVGPIKVSYSRDSRLAYDLYRKAAMFVNPFLELPSTAIRMERS